MTNENKEKKNMGKKDIAMMMQAGFLWVDERLCRRADKMDSRTEDMKKRIDSWELRAFTDEEKEEILATVRHYDKRLESETFGKDSVDKEYV